MHITPNNKRYVGITSQKPNRRWRNGNGYKENQYFTNAINKYGWNNIQHIIVRCGLSLEEALVAEKSLIKHYKSADRKYGYNITTGGDISGIPLRGKLNPNYGRQKVISDETKKKISIANRGENNYWYGKHLPITIKTKLSEANSVSVAAYNDEGILYKVYKSSTQAALDLGLKSKSSIGNAIFRNIKAGGYRWRKYTGKQVIEPFTKYESRRHFGDKNAHSKRLYQYDKDGQYIREWSYLKEAANYYKISSSTLSSGIKRQHLVHGYQWFYKFYGKQIKPYKNNNIVEK